ncbi:hypothetical protein KR084_010750, partial [Drosophila pseudotakahashii]
HRLPSSFKQLMEEGDFADCCVIVGTRRFPCHKVILGAASEFFKRTFQPGFAESKTGEVTLTDVTEDTFEKFRLYVYTYDRTSINNYSNQDIIKLKECANMWMVKPLQLVCMDIFQKRFPNMIYSDLLLYFEYGHHVYDMKLVGQISKGLNQNIRGKSIPEEIYELGSDVFREYLKVINGSVTEKCRFEMVEKYVAIHGFELNQSDLNKCECHELINQSKKKPEELLINSDQKTEEYVNPNSIEVKNSNFSDADSVSLDPWSKKINNEYMKTVLSLIDYPKMTVNEFFEGPGKSKIMSVEDKFNYLYKIAAKTAAENDRLRNNVN